MNTKTLCSILALSLIILTCAPSERATTRFQTGDWLADCQSRIDSVLTDSIFTPVFFGAKVVSLGSGKTLYERNSRKLFRAASNMKLLTTASALALLGRDFQFKTEVYVDASHSDGILEGSIYLKGYGDPLLRTDDLDTLARAVKQSGIREVRGDVIADVSYFDDQFLGKGWSWDDDPSRWFPYLSALTVNRGTIALTVTPGTREGVPPSVSLNPPTSYFSIINKATTSSDTSLASLTVTRKWKERENALIVEGALPSRGRAKEFELNVWKPEEYVLTLFAEKLAHNGVAVAGRIRLDRPKGGTLIAAVSHSLDTVINLVNKESYNLGAEHILKTIAAEHRSAPGIADSGIVVIKQYLAAIGLDTSAIAIADGSGLSRLSLISPEAIVDLLVNIQADSTFFQRFQQSLAVPGMDGTMKTRLTGAFVQNNVWAKTGTHSDVSTLSGFLRRADGDWIAFSIMFNNFIGSAAPFRSAQDTIVQILFDCQ